MIIWRDFPKQCDLCGAGLEIQTDEELDEGIGHDGDEIRCPECLAKGQWSVYSPDDAFVNLEP